MAEYLLLMRHLVFQYRNFRMLQCFSVLVVCSSWLKGSYGVYSVVTHLMSLLRSDDLNAICFYPFIYWCMEPSCLKLNPVAPLLTWINFNPSMDK